jgi:hypothetical protein
MMIHLSFEVDEESIQRAISLQFFITKSEVGNEILSVVPLVHNDFVRFR